MILKLKNKSTLFFDVLFSYSLFILDNQPFMNNDLTLWEEKNSTEPMKKNENSGETVKINSISVTKTDSTKNDLKDTTKISGIYKIVNKVNGKYYVGSTNNFKNRWREHRNQLIRGRHHSYKLQNAVDEFGFDQFEFTVIETPVPEILFVREQIYLDECGTDPTSNYNVSYVVGHVMTGRKHSEETKRKLRLAQTGKTSPRKGVKLSDETRLLLSKINTGKNNPNYGKKVSNETKLKIGEANKGRKMSEEQKLKLKEYIGPKNSRYGKTVSVETRKKISSALIGNTNGIKVKPS